MALLNRLFSSRKGTNGCAKTREGDYRKLCVDGDQIRLVLFQECDFRGRKLLFDSEAMTDDRSPMASETESSKHHRQFSRSTSATSQLGELVFGSIALSYRGTSYKIHRLEAPDRLMFSQIFPGPRHRRCHTHCGGAGSSTHSCSSDNSSSSFSLERATLADDSGVSSVAESINEHSTYNLHTLDSWFTNVVSKPLNEGTSQVLSVNRDSGFVGEKSNTSISSGPQSLPMSTASSEGEENCLTSSFYHKWSRNTAKTSLAFPPRTFNSSSSFDCLYKPNGRSSKLGLAIIVRLFSKQESSNLEQFLMEHATLVDLALWRIRQSIENAHSKQSVFASLMQDITMETVSWLSDLLAGPRLNANFWSTAVPIICDKTNDNNHTASGGGSGGGINFLQALDCFDSFEFSPLLNLTKYLRNEIGGNDCVCRDKNFIAERCISEFCELLVSVDVKQTNFFMSTLITAVLTHHLGWVATVLPFSVDGNENEDHSDNPFWVRFGPLYGAVGKPTKIAHTLVTGKKQPELISKILNCLTYFVRCGKETRRKFLERAEIPDDGSLLDQMCVQNASRMSTVVDYKQYVEQLLTTRQHDVKRRPLASRNSLRRVSASEFLQTDNQTEAVSANGNGANSVIFVLGDEDQLVGLKKNDLEKSNSKSEENAGNYGMINSWSSEVDETRPKVRSESYRSKSEPPENSTDSPKLKYSGVKFNIRRYPQIVTNYMRSKNLEMTRWSMAGEKSMTLLNLEDENHVPEAAESQLEEFETLQTPSNASELAFTSIEMQTKSTKHKQKQIFKNLSYEHRATNDFGKLDIVELPFPKSMEALGEPSLLDYTSSLMRGVSDRYLSDMVLQGVSASRENWEPALRRDLLLTCRHSLLNQQVDEAIAIVANTDTWDVQLVSSHTHMVDRGCLGLRVGMSQLVANMLESLLQMWKLRVPPKYCILHIEHSLQEFCLLSKALVELLLATEFCSIELVTSTLHLEVNDIPLLLAVASTYSPQVTQKYGLSFR